MRKAFTLIELLVVIAIIAILAGMLMPALARAREQGYRTACLNNEKNIGLMITMFQNDERRFPSWTFRDANGDLYYDSSLSLAVLYANGANALSPELFLCPSTQDPVTMAQTDEGGVATHEDNPANNPPIYANAAAPANTVVSRFVCYPVAYSDINASGPNDPSYVIDPSTPPNAWPGRPILADGPDMSLLRAEWVTANSGGGSGPAATEFPASQYSNHSTGLNVLFADSSVRYVRMRADGSVQEPRLTATDLVGTGITAAAGQAAIAASDIFADDALDYNGTTWVNYGDARIDAHLGSWTTNNNAANGDVYLTSGFLNGDPGDGPWAGPSSIVGYALDDVH